MRAKRARWGHIRGSGRRGRAGARVREIYSTRRVRVRGLPLRYRWGAHQKEIPWGEYAGMIPVG